MAELQITSLETLKKIANGEIVELPPFDDGTPFVARLKRPSLISLISAGKIPNALLSSVSELFGKKEVKPTDSESVSGISDSIRLCRLVAEAALVEPSLKSIEELGISLSQNQLMAIFNYTQTGVVKLRQFREVEGNSKSGTDSKKVPNPAKRNTRA